MAQNNILRFCETDTTTNLLTQPEYVADSQRTTGNQPGPARAKLVNKAMRQSSTMVAGLAEWLAGLQAVDIADTLTPAALQAIIDNAFATKFAALLAAAQVQLPGTIMMWPASTPPAGWMKRNGAAVSRTTYAALFAIIGTTYGAGDGSTTFNLPDDRAMFMRGWDDSRGIDVGRVFGSLQSPQNMHHVHTGTTNTAGLHNHGVPNMVSSAAPYAFGNSEGSINYVTGITTSDGSHTHSFSTDGSGGPETRPYNRAYLPIIKF